MADVRATVYLRQSQDRRDTGDAVERQLEDCRRLCEREGLRIVRVITDNDRSASSKCPRPGYRELLSDVEHGATDVIVAQTQDRLLRKPAEMESLIDLVERAGTRVMLVRAHVDLTTAMGRASARQAAVWSRLEVEQKAERQVNQAQQAARRGKVPSRRAFGYRNVGSGDDRQAVIDEAEAAVVRDAFARLLRGDSLVTITAAVNAAGLLSTRGKRWDRKMVRAMLLNSRHAGIRSYHGAELCRGQWEPIVSEEDWRKAVDILNDPARRANFRGTARRWIGTGLYRCGRCGSDMRLGYRSAANGSSRTYVCRSRGHLSRSAAPVDDLVLRVIRVRLGQLAGAGLAEQLMPHDAPEVAWLRQESAAIEAAVTRAMDDYDAGRIDAETLAHVKAKRRGELAVVQRKIAAAVRSSRLSGLTTAADPVAAFDALDLTARREVIALLVDVVLLPVPAGPARFDPETVKITFRG